MNEGPPTRAWADLRSARWPALGFHLLMQLLGLAILTPLVAWLGSEIVLASGSPVITNYDIASFVLSPAGFLFVFTIAVLTFALLLAELAGLSVLAGRAIAGERPSLPATVAAVLRRLPALALLGGRVFLRLVLLALPFLAIAGALWWTTLREHDINYYLAEHPPEWRRALVLGGLLGVTYALLAARQLALWSYALPVMVFEHAAPWRALTESERLTRGRLLRIVLPLVLWWGLLTAFAIVAAWAARFVSDGALEWAGTDFRRVLPLVAVFVLVALAAGLVYGALHLAGHQFLLTRMYAEQVDARMRAAPEEEQREARSRALVQPVIAGIAALAVLAFGAAYLVASRLDLEGAVAITAHRGASGVAPENTMAAFRAAMEAGATYSELDVQRTRDGQVVVLHDGDLMRMGGDPRRLRDLDLADLAGIDIGTKRGAEFAAERVPTLEQVIDLARGRMKINVELKYNVPDPELVPAVVDVLRRTEFLDQVVITSLDYAALKQVRALEPRLKTGHIVTAAVGDVVRTEADFLSLNAARATPVLLRRARAAGKQVHVWTVNDPDVVLRMIERRVDNIITDDPALIARLVADRRQLGRGELLAVRLRVLFDRPPRELTDPAAVPLL